MIIIFITGFLTGFSASFTAFNISLYKSNPINAFMNRIVTKITCCLHCTQAGSVDIMTGGGEREGEYILVMD